MLRKLNGLIIKVIAIIGIIISALFTLNGSITMTSSTSGLINSGLNKAASNSGNEGVQTGVQLFQSLGLESLIANQLPKKITLKTSLTKFKQTAQSIQTNHSVTANDFDLKNSTDQEKILNDVLVKLANNEIQENKETFNQIAQYYQLGYYIILFLYLIAIIMVLFGNRGAIIPLLIASVGSYEILKYGSTQAMESLQQTLYSGIKINLGGEFMTSVTIAIIISIGWLFLAKVGSKKKVSSKPAQPHYKHQA
ncbi:hypothetical protein FP435_02930 [Lactobacillus sp. PV037]|uniref:hypothetical protein n=1 Tax=unclassified Lactobacillus TaxID=2620435 RepID=UPI0022401C5F|nr:MULTISPECIES: hypothetical protein [unclassified Lactobacillus]QNQ82421.1 hypothetical protein FP433_04895 [Lactobacillus sp. PV012]QNQ83466.1 hypothetical protein FP435_02930 [Lactobacillus sp. PV037]